MEQEPLRVFATAHFPWRWLRLKTLTQRASSRGIRRSLDESAFSANVRRLMSPRYERLL